MNKLILAAAITNALQNTPAKSAGAGNWDNVIAMPAIVEGSQIDYRNPSVSSRNALIGEGRFGGQCFRFTGAQLFTLSNSPFALHGDFTMEAFVNFDQITESNQYIFDFGSNGFTFRYYRWGTHNGFMIHNSGNPVVDTAFVPVPGTWHHVAIVRRNGLITVYIDGVNRGQGTFNNSMTHTHFTVGNYVGGGYGIVGRIDQVRITAEALYTANFTPPAEAFNVGSAEANFDPYWDKVVLLASDSVSGQMMDSKGIHTIEKMGAAVVSSLTKKIAKFSMDCTVAGSYFKVEDTANQLDFGAGEWCLEGWFRPTQSKSGITYLIGRGTGTTFGGFSLALNNMFPVIRATTTGASWNVTTSQVAGSAIQLNCWTHIAASRVGNTISLFVNGEVIATASITGSITGSTIPMGIGAGSDGDAQFVGFIDSVRVTRGEGRYYSNFTPKMKTALATNGNIVESANDPYYAKVNAMLPFSKNFSAGVDMWQIVTQRAGVSLDPSRKLFGQDTLTVQSGAAGGINYSNGGRTTLGAVDCTVEGWINTDYVGRSDNLMPMIGQYHTSTTGSWVFGVVDGKASIFIRGGVYLKGTTQVNNSQWHHIAVSIQAGIVSLYVNGILEASAPRGVIPSYDGNIQIGYNIAVEVDAGYRMNISRVRITQGRARYTGNFTPNENTVVQAALAA